MLDVSSDATYIRGVIQADSAEEVAMSLLWQAVGMSSVALVAMGLLAWLAYAEREGG